MKQFSNAIFNHPHLTILADSDKLLKICFWGFSIWHFIPVFTILNLNKTRQIKYKHIEALNHKITEKETKRTLQGVDQKLHPPRRAFFLVQNYDLHRKQQYFSAEIQHKLKHKCLPTLQSHKHVKTSIFSIYTHTSNSVGIQPLTTTS